MCGLYGYITNKKKNNWSLTNTQKQKRKTILKGLMVANEIRGADSTGIGIIQSGIGWGCYKNAQPASVFVRARGLQQYLRKNPHIVIGHTRFATTGTIAPENAHPFKWGRILGAHNGIVSNYLEIDRKVNVDSEAIFRLLSRNSNNFIKTFKRLSGQFAISWVDLKDPDSVYLVRHDNPLFCAVVPELSTIFWSSVYDSLETVIKEVMGEKHKFNTFLFGVDKTYKIDSRLQIKKTRIEFKPFVYDGTSAYEYSGYNHDSKDYDYESDEDLSDTPLFPKDKLTVEYKKEIASEYGCSVCNEIVGNGFWFDDDKQVVICRSHYYTYKHKGPLSWTNLYPSDLVDFKVVHRTP